MSEHKSVAREIDNDNKVLSVSVNVESELNVCVGNRSIVLSGSTLR